MFARTWSTLGSVVMSNVDAQLVCALLPWLIEYM